MISRPVQLAGIALGVTGLLATAYLMIMTTFMVYDDEGFVLISLRRFLGGEPLYDQVFSQYGPAPYLYHWLVTLGGTIDLTHMFGRMLTMIHWVACAGGVGWVAARLVDRNRLVAGAFGSIFAFNLLWQMVAEPSHPGSMIAAMLTIAAVLMVESIRRRAFTGMAAALGLVGAVLVFTKINVGAFFITGIGAFALSYSAWPDGWRRPAQVTAAVGLLLLPWPLMAGNLHNPAMFAFAAKASLAGAALVWILPAPAESSRLPIATWLHTVVWFLAGLAAIAGFVLLRGTSLPELVSAVFIDPLRQPGNFTVAPRSSWPSAGMAAISFAIVGWAGWQRRRTGEIGGFMLNFALGIRVLLTAGFVCFALRWPAPWGVFTYLDYVLPLLPLWLVRPRADQSEVSWTATAGIAFLAVTQVLHAYPVAGSQIGWGCFLSVTVMTIGLIGDGRAIGDWRGPGIKRVFLTISIVAATAGSAHLGRTGWERYRNSTPLPFAGAGDIRLDDRTRIALTTMVQNAAVHSDVLFTRQGMYSFNIWSDTPTPTARNATHWFWLLDEQEQQETIDRLTSTERSAFIVNEPLDEFLARIDVPVAGPLQDFVESHYQTAFQVRGFAFRLPAGRRIAKLGYAQLLLLDRDPPDPSPPAPFILSLDAIIQGRPVSIEAVEFDALGNHRPSEIGFVQPEFSPMKSDGSLMGTARPLSEAGQLQGIYNFTAKTDRPARDWNFRNRGVVIRDADGRILAEALFE